MAKLEIKHDVEKKNEPKIPLVVNNYFVEQDFNTPPNFLASTVKNVLDLVVFTICVPTVFLSSVTLLVQFFYKEADVAYFSFALAAIASVIMVLYSIFLHLLRKKCSIWTKMKVNPKDFSEENVSKIMGVFNLYLDSDYFPKNDDSEYKKIRYLKNLAEIVSGLEKDKSVDSVFQEIRTECHYTFQDRKASILHNQKYKQKEDAFNKMVQGYKAKPEDLIELLKKVG